MNTEPKIGRGGVSRHLALLGNEDVDRWFRNLRSGSEKTAKVWLSAVGRFLESRDLTPEGLLGLTGDKATRLLEDYRDEFQSKSSATVLVIKAVKSLLARKGIALTQRIKVQRKDTVHEQHVPTQAELRKVFGAANLRARAAIGIMAFSGCRIEVMGDGRDGLRIADIPDLRLIDVEGRQEIEWSHVPARIAVRGALSKTGKPYFTFLGPEGVGYLEAYLRARIGHERLTPRAVVIGRVKVNGYHKRLKTRFEFAGEQAISGTKISEAIRAAMRQAGINERPYIWRSFVAAQADRCRDLPTEWREFFEGHNSGVAKTYTLNKGLSPEKVEDMRAAYARALPLLETGQPEALNRVAEVERRLAELVAAKPEVRTMADLRERADLRALVSQSHVSPRSTSADRDESCNSRQPSAWRPLHGSFGERRHQEVRLVRILTRASHAFRTSSGRLSVPIHSKKSSGVSSTTDRPWTLFLPGMYWRYSFICFCMSSLKFMMTGLDVASTSNLP
jgi:hypothetical protein